MIKSFNILPLILLIGLFMLPNSEAIACGKAKTMESCCDKKGKADCCNSRVEDITNSNENETDEHGCSGKCGQKICHCNNIIATFLAPSKNENKKIEQYIETNKTRVSGNENLPSSIFLTIWTPPNIG